MERVLTLIALFREAYRALFELLSGEESLALMERRAGEILEDLVRRSRAWIEENLPAIYEEAQREVLEDLADRGAGDLPAPAWTPLDEETLRVQAEDLHDGLQEAVGATDRHVRRMIREAAAEALREKRRGSRTMREAKDALREKLEEQGIAAFTDSLGRRIGLDAYAETAIRSGVIEMANRARLNQTVEAGYDLVQMTEHTPTCPVCARYEGRVYSISGRSPGYPPLWGTAFGRFALIHPRCAHLLVPYVPHLADDPEGDRQKSNRPFLDERTKRQRDAYERGQEKKRKARETYKQWERYRARLGDEAPSLRSFRAAKRAGGKRWEELQSRYREAGRR